MADIFKQYDPGNLPIDLFNDISRLVVTPVIEIVPFRVNSSKEIEVLLLKKGSNDKWWPSMYHVPGTIISATDDIPHFKKAFQRLLKGKLMDLPVSSPLFINNVLSKTSRGVELALIYSVTFTDHPPIGEIFKIDTLPSQLIENHREFIQLALDNHRFIP